MLRGVAAWGNVGVMEKMHSSIMGVYRVQGLGSSYIGVILGYYWDNGKSGRGLWRCFEALQRNPWT